MTDFDAPPGPPPPKVPEGWVARWNDQYKEWFFVNTFTKKSQWEKPTEPARRPEDDDLPSGPPPSYTPSTNTPAPSDAKSKNPFDDSKPTLSTPSSSSAAAGKRSTEDDDARLARQLQAEEDARAHASSRSPSGRSPFPSQLPPRPDNVGGGGGDKSRGLLGKIFNKRPQGQQQSYNSNPPAPYASYGSPAPQAAPYGGYSPAPQPAPYGGYPQQGGYYQQPAYGGYPPPQGGYYQQPVQQQQQSGRTGGGMGMMGGAALGVGAGLLGGMLIEDVIHNDEQQAYQQGFDNGADYNGGGGYDGGDFDGGGF